MPDGQVLEIGGAGIRILSTPGHTRTSVCYHLEPSGGKPGAVFTGDTLFTAGCGRVLECSMPEMWQSLQKLAALPDETVVCGGHDYIVENLEFSLTVEPGNDAVKRRLREAKLAEREGRVLSGTIGDERQTNIFLRASSDEVRAAMKMPHASPDEVFAVLRRRKDRY
jgi:hydroxyacylglutathione hydrolase